MVFDGDPDSRDGLVGAIDLGDRDLGRPASVQAGVVDQVGDDAGQTAPVARDQHHLGP